MSAVCAHPGPRTSPAPPVSFGFLGVFSSFTQAFKPSKVFCAELVCHKPARSGGGRARLSSAAHVAILIPHI